MEAFLKLDKIESGQMKLKSVSYCHLDLRLPEMCQMSPAGETIGRITLIDLKCSSITCTLDLAQLRLQLGIDCCASNAFVVKLGGHEVIPSPCVSQ